MDAPAKRSNACEYCGIRRAVNQDHVIPKSYVRKYERGLVGRCTCSLHEIPPELLVTVGACFECNNLKGTRRLVPPSWADRIDMLNDLAPGTPWRVWDGDPMSPAFREVHV